MTTLRDVQEAVRASALAARFPNLYAVAAASRRIGVPEPSSDPTDAGERVTTPPGEHLTHVPQPIWRRLAMGVSPKAPDPGGTAFCEDWADVDFAIGALSDLRVHLDDTKGLSPGTREAETDNLRKAVLERGRSGDGHVSVEGITNDSTLTIPGFEFLGEWLAALGKPYRSDWDLDLSVVRGTSHGWPTFVPANDPASDVDLACHAWLAGWLASTGYSLTALSAAVKEAVPQLTLDACAQMFFRTGPMAKPTPHYKLLPMRDGAVEQLGSTIGYFCRERQVFAVPTCVNLLLRPAATRVKVVMRQNYSFMHGDAKDLVSKMRRLSHLHFFSEDISGFDRSVTRGMQRDLLGKVYRHFLSPNEMSLYDQLQSLPVLAPPLASDSAGFLYSRSGMTISGSIFTTNDGSLINAASIAFSVSRALEVPLADVWAQKGVRWDFLVLGDDCVIGLDTWSDDVARRYKQARIECGFKTDLFPGIVFLMTSLNASAVREGELVAYGILSRAVSKTFFREDPARSPLVDMFGLYHRWARCADHPLAPWAWDRCVARAPGAKRLGVGRTLGSLRAMVEHPAFVSQLLKEARDVGVRASLRNLLTGMGHGDIVDGLKLSPAALSFMGGTLASEFLGDHQVTGTLMVPDALELSFATNRRLWLPYMASRLQDQSAARSAAYLIPSLAHVRRVLSPSP